MHCWMQDENPRDMAHDFRLMGATFEKKMNQSVTETREANLWGSYRKSNTEKSWNLKIGSTVNQLVSQRNLRSD